MKTVRDEILEIACEYEHLVPEGSTVQALVC